MQKEAQMDKLGKIDLQSGVIFELVILTVLESSFLYSCFNCVIKCLGDTFVWHKAVILFVCYTAVTVFCHHAMLLPTIVAFREVVKNGCEAYHDFVLHK